MTAFSGIVNKLLSTVLTPLVNVIAPFPGFNSVDVKSVKVAVPVDAALVIVPPIVHDPVPDLAVATTFEEAEIPVVQ